MQNTIGDWGLGVVVMPYSQCFKLLHVKFLLMNKNVITVTLFLRSLM